MLRSVAFGRPAITLGCALLSACSAGALHDADAAVADSSPHTDGGPLELVPLRLVLTPTYQDPPSSSIGRRPSSS